MLLTGLRALQFALGAVCLYLAYVTVSPAFASVASAPELPRGSRAPERAAVETALIVERNLFGSRAPVETKVDEPPENEPIADGILKQKYKLFGTLVSSTPENSIANLFHIAKRESLFLRMNESVERCPIERIERKRVVVRCEKGLEQISIDEDEAPGGALAAGPVTRRSVAQRPTPAPARAASSDLQARLEKIKAARERNQEREAARARGLMQQAKITPSFGSDGSFEGIIINDAKPDGPLADLPDGTPCTTINGGRIGSIQDLSPVLQSVEGETVTLGCTTPDGRQIDVNL